MPDTAATTGHVARRLLVHGRVQGVYYRASAQAEARRLGLTGWARNLSGGEVEALVQGPEAAVERFTDWARTGPPKAQVTRLEVVVAALVPYADFTVLPDA